MGRRTLTQVLSAQQRAYDALSTPDRPVTHDLVRLEPSISAQLEVMTETLLKEIPVTKEVEIVGDDGKPKVTTLMENIFPYGITPNLVESWPRLLKLTDMPEAKRVIAVYERLSRAQAKSVPVEAFCYAAGVSSLRILEILTGVIVRQGAQATSILAAVWQPRIVEKTIQMALTDEGIADRAFMHRATGFLPTPKGSQTTINVQQNANRTQQVEFVPAPPPEATIRALADTFNEAKGLPATIVAQPSIDLGVDDEPDDGDE